MPYNMFSYNEEAEIKIRSNSTRKFKFWGQFCSENICSFKGVGMAQYGNGELAEGHFEGDALMYPLLWTKKGTSAAYFQVKEGDIEKTYLIDFNKKGNFQGAQRFQTKDVKGKIWKKKEDFLESEKFDFDKYFIISEVVYASAQDHE